MVSPRDALSRLSAAGLPGLVLLESAGEITSFSRYSYLSAAPTEVSHTLPKQPQGLQFPAWIGGLTFEASEQYGLPSRGGGFEHWAYYPSGLVWDRLTPGAHCVVVGEPHLDWESLLRHVPHTPQTISVGPLTSSYTQHDFEAAVKAVQGLILAGECYQVNLAQRLEAEFKGSPLDVYMQLAEINPSPFMVYLEGLTQTEKPFVICSSSPERLVLWENGQLSSRPIAGTRRRGDNPEEEHALEVELAQDPKEQAEHVMLVDLERNDLGRIAMPGSVCVSEFKTIEYYSHVMHLVSEVQARAKENLSPSEMIEATFPGGTITGAPKKRVMEAICELEPVARGWYTGSVGILCGARVDFNILIRTLSFEGLDRPNRWNVSAAAGAGIVIDSQPHLEYRETLNKAAALLGALQNPGRRPAKPPRPPLMGMPYTLTQISALKQTPVLVLDNFDSFTYNLVQDLEALGARVTVCSHDTPLGELCEQLERNAIRHVLLGPGPGTPLDSGVTLDFARWCIAERIPILGVCLGHQALGELLGGRLLHAPYPVHGKPEAMVHNQKGLFLNIPQDAPFTRYHSLILRDLPEDLCCATARTHGGELMAFEVPSRPIWGVQFHPESILSTHGRTLLSNWIVLGHAWNDRTEVSTGSP